MTMVIATHEMGFARDVANRVAFLEEGRILEEGPPERMFSGPREEATAASSIGSSRPAGCRPLLPGGLSPSGPRLAWPMPPFKITSEFRPSGDQPEAIDRLVDSVQAGRERHLLGRPAPEDVHRCPPGRTGPAPTLVIAPNKSLAAQLANEFHEVFPENAVEYFVSYYDYYQPEPTSRRPTPTSRRTRR